MRTGPRRRADEYPYHFATSGNYCAGWFIGILVGLALCVSFNGVAKRAGVALPEWLWFVLTMTGMRGGKLLAPRRTGFRVDESGLTDLWHLSPARHHPWTAIRGVVLRPRSATILTSPPIEIDAATHNWRRLALLIRERTQPQPVDDQAPAVPADQVCEWLGIAPGEVLVCRDDRLTGPAGLAASCGLLVALFAGSSVGPLAPLVGVSVGLLVYLDRLRNRQVIRADGDGFTVRSGQQFRCYRWSDVQQLTGLRPGSRFYLTKSQCDADMCYLIDTTDTLITFYLADANGRALMESLVRILAARDAGQRLPAGSAVTPASLSRPRLTGEEAAERGLSAVRDEQRS